MSTAEALKESIELAEAFGRGCNCDDYSQDVWRVLDLCKSALAELEKCEPVADALRFLKSHDCIDDEGYEYGICKVKFDNRGKAAEVLWSDIDAVIKLKSEKGIV